MKKSSIFLITSAREMCKSPVRSFLQLPKKKKEKERKKDSQTGISLSVKYEEAITKHTPKFLAYESHDRE